MPDTAEFSSLPLPAALLDNLASLEFTTMTPVQAAALPVVLEGRDVIARGRTGSGKTAAFGLGVLTRLRLEWFAPQALVLCPTRELADQVAAELRRLGRSLPNLKVLELCGGTSIGRQIHSLTHGAHVLVGTPGRVEALLRKGSLSPDALSMLVLDEADRMLDMGFEEVLEAIMSWLPVPRQTLLFSATWPEDVQALAQAGLVNPAMVQAGDDETPPAIEEHFHLVERGGLLDGVTCLLSHYRPAQCLVFCETKRETQETAEALRAAGWDTVALHGDLEQRERDEALLLFSQHSARIMVATDVAARGLDIPDLALVISMRIARDLDVHVHRIGRTGRAGQAGRAVTLFTSKEGHQLQALASYLDRELMDSPLPAPGHEGPSPAPMVTLAIDGGKKQKLRPGDIVGALTRDGGLAADDLGRISVQPTSSYVAVARDKADQALNQLKNGRLKGRQFRARRLRIR
ncbi:ATP-dependent RNA helicase DbpA [Larsenimonas rhizosphaerae]|uniref:ATP-dependent RNA helicase DbpA n=1 Tax=Larsenimonas rhizosphaerae TaxID=2944682 RepID=A0AA41ZCH1_9GAMM|nr:ATP-dependent RNA helicase DbpA [Larsenimonas rhizosphaerae]MCM2130095.1 ATP-dependent RNA helicase DbpA [Larsenimonas rhizosphaerae]MCX2522782.1 ATP-dependent RNA helicase DbpA [Larsenimonas rhizosphaerae]